MSRPSQNTAARPPGFIWFNSLDDAGRRFWLAAAMTAVPAKAYDYYVRSGAAALPAGPLYQVSLQRADGSAHNYTRIGGNTTDHAQEAMNTAGLGGVVRVVQLGQMVSA